jgi:site-specific DNA-methyltransferase (adenine-specific)
MPESVTDRCTKAHEYVFLLSKSPKYHYDAEAIAEPATSTGGGACFGKQGHDATGTGAQSRTYERPVYETRNARSVWTITTKPYKGAHFATMPPDLAGRCIAAGCPGGGVVLEPFAGSGTTLAVAVEMGRRAIGCELNPAYHALIAARMANVTPSMFSESA